MSSENIDNSTPTKDAVVKELEDAFVDTVKDGGQLLKERASIVTPIFSAWAEGKIMLMSSDKGTKRLGANMIESARRSLADQYGALKADTGDLVMDRLLHGLQVVFTKVVLPIVLGAITG